MNKLFAATAMILTLAWGDSALGHEGVHVEIANLGVKIQKEPKNTNLYLERAVLLRRDRQFDKALADLATAEKLAPERREITLEKGLTLALAGRNEMAETLLSAYLANGLPSAKAFAARGRIRENAKRWGEARADYAAWVRLAPNPDAFLARGRMDEAMLHWDDAARGYEEGLRLLSGAIVLRLALVRVENRRGHYDRAIALIDEMLPQLPFKADWLLLRADQYAALAKPESARKDREEALREIDVRMTRRPTAFVRMARAKALYALGRNAAAWREIEIVTHDAPQIEEARQLREKIRLSLAK